jgi:hypothetical protein
MRVTALVFDPRRCAPHLYDKEEVNFYDPKTTKITVSEEAVLKGWLCLAAGLWQLPLVKNPVSLNTDTLLLDHPTKL